MKFVRENNGWFPVKLEALPEGTCANIHVPVYQITAEGVYSPLCTFMETILTQLWYPTTVATLSRRSRDLFEDAFQKSVPDDLHWLIESRLHDFGFRGCTCVEQSVIGGSAHLLNFSGTDTMSAAYYVQFHLNEGKHIGESIPATEHSVMTSWPNEADAILNMIDKYGGEKKIFACVMDSYDYVNALEKILPVIKTKKQEKGGIMVLRPDSGDPTDSVMLALRSADKLVGSTLVEKNNSKWKMINGFNVIQGDGINYSNIKKIIDTYLAEGFSATNVAFGMGGGLLQKINRDTMSFATKLSYIKYADKPARNVMKKPKEDSGKCSLPGILKVLRVNGVPTVFPAKEDENDPNNLLKVVWNCGPVKGHVWEKFDTLRERIKQEWPKVPKTYDPVSQELKQEIKTWIENFEKNKPY